MITPQKTFQACREETNKEILEIENKLFALEEDKKIIYKLLEGENLL